ncbi:MAG: non-ribosomal peptide synthetase, partial [Blastocatellia bacterium]
MNMYGPTETTIWSTVSKLGRSGDAISVGRPIDNTQVHILNERMSLAPIGAAGELYIAGEGLARGYRGRPELTAEKFVPNEFGRNPGGRAYRTGDVARHWSTGMIELIGRVDNQIKLRGFRIELAEIETALLELDGVRDAAVVALEQVPGDKRLAAFLVADREVADGIERIRTALALTLPDYMIPASFVILPAMPLNSNGKLDRKALIAATAVTPVSRAAYTAPRSETERLVAGIWCEVLKLERVGANDNFFDLGGHSLLMAQAHSRLREVFGRDIPLIKALEHPTVRSLATYLSYEKETSISVEDNLDRARKQRQGLRRQRQQFRARPN